MNQENTKKLIDDFPNLYKQKDLPPIQSLMCFGFECGDGWFDLLCKLSEKLSKDHPEVEAVQVKEKYGGLRFYINNGSDKAYDLIDEAAAESYGTCENCGTKQNVTQNEVGWILTLCDNCREERRSKC